MGSLEADFNILARLDSGIPAHIGRGIGIATDDISTPTGHDARAAVVAPIKLPTIDGAGASVGDANRTDKTRSPIIDDGITAIARARNT